MFLCAQSFVQNQEVNRVEGPRTIFGTLHIDIHAQRTSGIAENVLPELEIVYLVCVVLNIGHDSPLVRLVCLQFLIS